MVQDGRSANWLPLHESSEGEVKIGDLVWVDYGPHSNVPRFMAVVTEMEVDPDGLEWNTLVHVISVQSNMRFAVHKADIKAIE